MAAPSPALLQSSSLFRNFYSEEPIRGALGGLPVAEQTQDYFVVFRQVGGTGPEIIGQTAYFITYLVDSDGNVSKPAEDEDALNNLIQNFPVGKNCIVRQDAATTLNSILSGKQQVTAIGKQLPILYTQTGFYTGSFSTAVSFSFQGASSNAAFDNLVDYRGYMTKTYDASTLSDGVITGYATIGHTPNASGATFDTSNGTYTIIPDTDLDALSFTLSFRVRNSYGTNQSFKLILEVNNGSSGYNNIAEEVFNVIGTAGGGGSTLDPDAEYGAENGAGFLVSSLEHTVIGGALTNLGSNPIFRARVECDSDFLGLDYFVFNVNNMNPQPGIVESGNNDFWETGPASPSGLWLTASSFLSLNHNNVQVSSYITDNAEENFNLSPIINKFKPRIGDRIRFEYNKQKEYYIYEVITPCKDPEGRLKLRINGYLPIGTEVNNFILHRTDVNTPSYIILNVDKDDSVEDTQDFNGLLLPEFPSDKLKKNLDSIITNLKEKGIIVDVQN